MAYICVTNRGCTDSCLIVTNKRKWYEMIKTSVTYHWLCWKKSKQQISVL